MRRAPCFVRTGQLPGRCRLAPFSPRPRPDPCSPRPLSPSPAAQPDPTHPYGAVHRAHAYGPDAYPHHVMPYVPGPPPPPHPHAHAHAPPQELMYRVGTPPQEQQQPHPALGPPVEPPQGPSQAQTQTQAEEGTPPPGASGAGKRKQPDSANGVDVAGKKRRQRVGAAGSAEDMDDGQDLEVGPNGGAKHWTEEDKTKFFTWMLTSDEHWDAFRTRMNTVFREVRPCCDWGDRQRVAVGVCRRVSP